MSDVIAMACGCQGRFKCAFHQGIDKGREQERARIIARIREEAVKLEDEAREFDDAEADGQAEVAGNDAEALRRVADLLESEETK